ncbi:conserved hypothetical protein [Sporisorium reilianum SRZ2]|uniref:Uncharacterized protein n=1 Tax=Sporisorium reilianum (strain SRZ2) TaxID=999809 RepID=E6ZXW3_SPORE|nr:conserved hypothetical protein [Sporisorium reilianum SRZ2]
MSGREHRVEAGPSDPRRQANQQHSRSPFSWTMSLFGGRQGKQPTGNRSLGWGRPGASASARNRDEREALISSTGGDDFDDSDAISLLSNIADRDSRRGGASAAARRRARARARAQGRACGTFWFDVEDWGRVMSCGLLGRGRDAQDAGAGRQRAASIGSVMSRGARRTNAPSSTASVVATSRHSRSLSDASTDSGASLAGSGFAESIDADAGMLDDQAIARFGQPSDTEADTAAAAAAEAQQAKAKADEEAAAKAKAEADAAEAKAHAERQAALEAEAARLQAEAEAEAQRQQEEEARLAAEEEAAIAKARRKAERKAAKAGLLKLQQETQAAQRWRTEAEAEAAAGGFTFADADADESHHVYAQQQFDYHDADYGVDAGMHAGEFDQYGDADEADGYYATVQEHAPGGVVHHHHYYHAPPAGAEAEEFVYPTSPHGHGAAAFADARDTEEPAATADKPESEDEADIAGLSFGRKKGARRADSGSASGSRSGAGLTARTTTIGGGSSSGGSASGHRPTSASSSSAGRAHYRDRPRRHERTSSKSSNSSSGIFSYHSSNTLHPNAAPSTVATSVTSPRALPNLYESEPIYAGTKAPQAEGDEVAQAQFGKPDVDANEFGVITAGTNKGGAGRVKKSYRDKRGQSQVLDDQAQGSFEGFPGF